MAAVVVISLMIQACGEERGALGPPMTRSVPSPVQQVPAGMSQAVLDWLSAADEGAVSVYLSRGLDASTVAAPVLWKDTQGYQAALLLMGERDGSWTVEQQAPLPIPPSGRLEPGFSSLGSVQLDGRVALGGFVDASATRVAVLDETGVEIDAQAPSAGAVVMILDRQAAQVRLESGSALLAATSIPVTQDVDLPNTFVTNPPDWREQVRELVEGIVAGGAGASNIYPGMSTSLVSDLRHLLELTPTIESTEGRGGAYVLRLQRDSDCAEDSDPICSAVLYLYVAPSDGEPKVLGYDYRPTEV